MLLKTHFTVLLSKVSVYLLSTRNKDTMKKLFLLIALFFTQGNALFAQSISGGASFEAASQIPTFNEMHSMSKDTTDHYLKFNLLKGEGVTVMLTAHVNSGSMSMYTYTPENQSSYFRNATYIYDGTTELISFTARTSGTYYLRISGNPGLAEITVYQSFYTVSVSDTSRDFYGTFNTAKYLTTGNHTLNDSGFSNYFRFEAKRGDSISINLTAHLTSGSVSMYAYTPKNQSNYFKSTTYIYDDETDSLSFTAQTTGTYYLRVSANVGNIDFVLSGVRTDTDTDIDGLKNSVEYIRGTRTDSIDTNKNGISDYNEASLGKIGKYPIEWTLSDMSEATSPTTAKAIPYLNRPFSVDRDETSRYLKFDMKQGEGVDIRLTAHVNSGSMSMYAYTPENQSSYFRNATYIYDGTTELISFTAETTGTYYLRVSGDPGFADIAVYQWFDTPGVSDTSRDFYGTFDTAKYLTAGNHTLNDLGFSNYFRFEAKFLDEISIRMTPHLMSGSVSMYAYTPEDQSSYFESATYIDDGETGLISFTAYSEGIFYLRVNSQVGNIDFELNGVRPEPKSSNPAVIMYLLN